MTERLKVVACELQIKDTLGYNAIRGALHRLQTKYGGSEPVMMIDEAECVTDNQTRTEWMYTIWEWAQENGVRLMHDSDAEQPRRENDCRLMDRGVSIKHKRAINRHLNEFRWMSDVRDEIGTAWNEAAQAVTDTE